MPGTNGTNNGGNAGTGPGNGGNPTGTRPGGTTRPHKGHERWS